MTPEEYDAAREYLSENWADDIKMAEHFENALQHIDAQAAQIENLERIKGNYCTEIRQLRKRADDLAEDHNEFFDCLNKQIEALKKMLITERATRLYETTKALPGKFPDSPLGWTDKAHEQLKTEMPGLEWE